MTPEQFAKLLNYIQENNSWAKLSEVVSRNRIAIKYVDSCFDSRTGLIWRIRLRTGSSKEGKIFYIKDTNIEEIYKFLNEPF